MRRIAPPLPAASQPSNTMMVETPLACAFRCSRFSRPWYFSSSVANVFFATRLRHVEAAENRRVLGDRPRPWRSALVRPAVPWRGVAAGTSLQRRPLAAALRERLAHRVPDRRRHREASVGFVHPFDDRPRRCDRARSLQGALGGRDEPAVHPPVLPLQRWSRASGSADPSRASAGASSERSSRDASRTSG